MRGRCHHRGTIQKLIEQTRIQTSFIPRLSPVLRKRAAVDDCHFQVSWTMGVTKNGNSGSRCESYGAETGTQKPYDSDLYQ